MRRRNKIQAQAAKAFPLALLHKLYDEMKEKEALPLATKKLLSDVGALSLNRYVCDDCNDIFKSGHGLKTHKGRKHVNAN